MSQKKNYQIVKTLDINNNDNNLKRLSESIKNLKIKLDNLLAENDYSKISNEMIKVSQELDKYINSFMRQKSR